MTLTDSQIGEAIINQIIESNLIRVSQPQMEEGDVFIWAANSAEQIGAKVRELLSKEINHA